MANRFSLKSLLDSDGIIYVAPILILMSLLHVFDTHDLTRRIGQMEILASIITVCYYLWDKIAYVYEPEKIGKKRIEAVVCAVVGLFSALVLIAPLMTWQFFNLYRTSDRFAYTKPILIAVLSLWIGCGVLFYSSAKVAMERVNAGNSGMPESSMPNVMEGQ